ncbi:flavonoid 3-O-glucosyltransferase isoform X2 [Ricinus communis]|uniref:flavonoid 3-O-glucosyltransferase isoform X2 n=1 Tax=Ricinus communis TaxID=3988 RepID=UPI0007725FF3|nr:flavonoid 3-O-glucosyltransferase isoform X2 [Ricinus communis]|eukprot:XP_015583673.1 flavonoid 3-O-glucosyltransferase isoform X2 [Ricinus communis]
MPDNNNNNNFTKHVAVLAFPFATHGAPLLSLVGRLSTASPHALFSFFSTAESNATIFKKHKSSEAVKSFNVEDGMPVNYVFSGNPLEPVENFLKATPGNFKSAMDAAVKESGMAFSCIITDAFFWFAAEMAQDLQIPWVALWTAGPRSLLMHLETDLIREKLGVNGTIELEKSVDFLPGFSALPPSRIPAEIIAEDLTAAFPTMLHKMGLMLPRANSVAINSFEELDAALLDEFKPKLQNFLNIGPLVLTLPDQNFYDPQSCLEWLDKQKKDSVVYISFGSVIMPPPHELSALAEALEACGFPFIWSFRGNPEEKLPKGFLDRTKEKGKIVSWAPQLNILQHTSTRAFMTHCGWNSVLESIAGGVPLICRPFFGDQYLNTWTVEAVWGVGVEIEGGTITKDNAIKALELVLLSAEGKQMKRKLEDLKKLAFDAASSHGSSTANFETLVKVVT